MQHANTNFTKQANKSKKKAKKLKLPKTTKRQANSLVSKEEFTSRLTKVEQELKRTYSDAYKETVHRYWTEMENAKTQREQRHVFFDNLTYTEDYIANQQTANTYLRPKKNDSEIRVNTSLSEKKVEVLYNELLALNLEADITAYDNTDLEVRSLGQDFADMVHRTNQIERDEDMWPHALWEYLTQRAIFLEETTEVDRIQNTAYKYKKAKKRLVTGLKVFLGDITLNDYLIDEQPYIFKYDRMNWRKAKKIFQDSPFWHLVEAQQQNDKVEFIGEAFNYRLAATAIEEGEVEVLTRYSVPDNEINYVVNGVLMYEPTLPPTKNKKGQKSEPQRNPKTILSEKHAKYPIRMYTARRMGEFAYGKSPLSSAKTLQGLSNEMIRLLLHKFQQSIKPPYGTKAGKMFGRDALDPGKVTQGLTDKDITKLVDHNGPNNAEIQMFQLIEAKAEESIGASDFRQGILPSGDLSATAVMEAQKNAAKMLGHILLGYNRMKRDLTELRIYTLAEHYYDPIGRKLDPITQKTTDAYRRFTLKDATLGNGRKGRKIIQLSDRDLTDDELEQIKEAEDRSEVTGRPFRFRSINRTQLKHFNGHFDINIVARQIQGSEMDKILFQDQLNQAVGIMQITQRPINSDMVIDNFETTWRVPNMFLKEQPQQPALPGQEGQQQTASPEGNQANDLLKDISEFAQQTQAGLGNSPITTGAQGGREQQRPQERMGQAMREQAARQ